VHKYTEDSFSALDGGVEGTVGIRIQFLHRQQHVSGSQRIEGLVWIDADIFSRIDIERPLVHQLVVLHHEHSFVFIPTVSLPLMRFTITTFVSASPLKSLSFAAHWRRRAEN